MSEIISLQGRKVVGVVKLFDFLQIVFHKNMTLDVYCGYEIANPSNPQSNENELLQSLTNSTLVNVAESKDRINLDFTGHQRLTLAISDCSTEPFELIVIPDDSFEGKNGFYPGMDLTDSFNEKCRYLDRIQGQLKPTLGELGLITTRTSHSGNLIDGVSRL